MWRQLDSDLWDLTHNPWGLLQTVSRDRIEQVLVWVRARIDELVQAKRRAAELEIYADGVMGSAPVRQEMTRVRGVEGADGGYVYRAHVPASRSATDVTARVIPHHDGVAVPLETARILWQQ